MENVFSFTVVHAELKGGWRIEQKDKWRGVVGKEKKSLAWDF